MLCLLPTQFFLTFHRRLVLPGDPPAAAAAAGHGRFQFQNRGSVLEERPAGASSAFLDHLEGRRGPLASARTISCLSSGLSNRPRGPEFLPLFLSFSFFPLPPDEQLTNYLFTLK